MFLKNKRYIVIICLNIFMCLGMGIISARAEEIDELPYITKCDKLFEYTDKTVMTTSVEYDEGIWVDTKYIPFKDTIDITVTARPSKHDEDRIDFVIYCTLMNFIEDETHEYFRYMLLEKSTTINAYGAYVTVANYILGEGPETHYRRSRFKNRRP